MAKFRLEPVLKLRRHREEDRKRDLARALAVENRFKDAALHIADLRGQHATRMREGQGAGQPLDIRTLIEHRSYIGLLDREIARQLRCVALAEHETRRRRQHLAAAMVDRKAMEVLRDKVLLAAQREEERRDESEMADLAIRRYVEEGAARPAAVERRNQP